MSEEQGQENNVETLKARIAELEAENQRLQERVQELEEENQRLRETIGKAEDTLKSYVKRERKTAIEAILEKSNWSKDELEKLDLSQLKLIQKTFDRAKGSFKSIRSAGSTADRGKGALTVGDLYRKKEEQ